MSRVRFEIVPPVERSEELLRVVGNHPHLGNWDPLRAPALRWDAPLHVGTIEVEPGMRLEFKVVREDWESEAVDARGNVGPNWTHDVWMDCSVRRVVADWKDRFAGRLTDDVVRSSLLASDRRLLIWLPPAYANETERRFPVIYFNDGDNVFDPASSPVSGVDWAADEWVRVLAAEGTMPEAIVVGICHPDGFSDGGISQRDAELSLEIGGTGYAEFIATEVVPHLDTHYRTLPNPGARILAGASLGALNAFYTALEHPDLFGRAACLSTAFEDVSQSLPRDSGMLKRIEARTELPANLRVAFDYGTEGLDECYEVYHTELTSLLRERGWQDGREFHVSRIRGGGHTEASWRLRLGDLLRWLATH